MLLTRYQELRSAGPRITRKEWRAFKRNPWMPKLTAIALAVRLAFSNR